MVAVEKLGGGGCPDCGEPLEWGARGSAALVL